MARWTGVADAGLAYFTEQLKRKQDEQAKAQERRLLAEEREQERQRKQRGLNDTLGAMNIPTSPGQRIDPTYGTPYINYRVKQNEDIAEETKTNKINNDYKYSFFEILKIANPKAAAELSQNSNFSVTPQQGNSFMNTLSQDPGVDVEATIAGTRLTYPDLPEGITTLPAITNWVYKKREEQSQKDSLERITAEGEKQERIIDYKATESPVIISPPGQKILNRADYIFNTYGIEKLKEAFARGGELATAANFIKDDDEARTIMLELQQKIWDIEQTPPVEKRSKLPPLNNPDGTIWW